MAVYQFDTEHAQRWGVNEAIFLHNLIHWLRKNKAEGRNVRIGEDGCRRVWTYSTTEALARLYAFWKPHQVRYVIDSLRKQGVILTGHFADQAFDRTLWFAVTDEALLELPDAPESPGEQDPDERAARFEKFRKSKRENPQMDLPKVADGLETFRTSLKETDSSSKFAETNTAAESPSAAAPVDIDIAIDAELIELIEQLVAADLNRADALRLASTHPDECRRQLGHLPFVTEFRTSRGAYLRAAIEQGFAPPPAWQQEQKARSRVENRRRRAEAARSEREALQAENSTRAAVLEAEKARLQREEPAEWAQLVAAATAALGPPLQSRPNHAGYAPALRANLDRLVAERLSP